MDWNAAIENNRQALKRIAAALFAMAGLGQAALAGRQQDSDCRLPTAHCRPVLPRLLHRAVLRLLRPAESAARRLVIVAARGLTPPAGRSRPSEAGQERRARKKRCACAGNAAAPARIRPLPLFDDLPDPLRRRLPRRAAVPRISFPGLTKPFPVAPRAVPLPHDPLDASRLAERLLALSAALDDLPAHALRFARWQARRHAASARPPCLPPSGRRRRGRISPLRPGRPPGAPAQNARRTARHEVHAVLDTLHGLAVWALERTDTS